jgi:DNA invertase Pin-like site-specific DNA recombinase
MSHLTGKRKRGLAVIAYYRVSTEKQGRSGLGLEAQKAAVQQYVASIGGKLFGEYTEVETAKRNADRPQLTEAILHAKRCRGRLVVAKMDRLTRNVAFLCKLRDSHVDFVACDAPHADKTTVYLLVMMAEKEAELISQRTKDALAVVRAKGKKLGAAREGFWTAGRDAKRRLGLRKATEAAKLAKRRKALEFDAAFLPEIRKLRAGGRSLEEIADALNEQGFLTRRAKQFSAMTVKRILDRGADGRNTSDS